MTLPADTYAAMDATAMAQSLRQGDFSAAELMAAAFAQIDAHNPRLNAVVAQWRERAMHWARQFSPTGMTLDGRPPFAGVPFLLKDMHQQLAGELHCLGSAAWRGRVAKDSSVITQRWMAAGLLPLGLSNACELGLKPQTESRHWGAVHNPWRRGLSAGGSSGGAAAAVASGMVPMAGGNDVGGSIRIPAAACGVFGFKPGRGRVSWSHEAEEVWRGAAVHHVLTRSVRDSAAMLDAVRMRQARDADAPSCLTAAQRGAKPLRIAFSLAFGPGQVADADCAEAVRATARRLQDMGHLVEEAGPALAWPDWQAQVEQLMCLIAREGVSELVAQGAKRVRSLEPDTRLAAALGAAIPARRAAEAVHDWHRHEKAWRRFNERFDVWLTPVTGRTGLPLGAFSAPDWQVHVARWLLPWIGAERLLSLPSVKARRHSLWCHVPCTPLANWLGLPAMSVPVHTSAQGLPVGVQCMAGEGREAELFGLAADLERAGPWGAPMAHSPCQL
ncbi:amidase [Aquabacterium lacunae]|uniref:Amidase n=2 Tax=Aquabacterium lacunae TaxID=2528630 RepID=A0A4Q9GY23_9BURK|nr:amidase [Aquabacterium lacunae]